MNSIYNDDIAIRNTIKENTMSNENNNTQGFAALSAGIIADAVVEIANNADITGDERDFILEAAARVRGQDVEIKRLRGHLNPFGDAQSVEIASLQAGLDSMSDDVKSLQGQLTDWQNSALSATDERDRLRVLVAEHEARIELLNDKINRLERCVIQSALNTSRLARVDEEETDEKIIFHAGRMVQNQIDHERQTDEDAVGRIINDLENGDY